jgi:RNA polymerase sigma-70 factor, ECF subfamily
MSDRIDCAERYLGALYSTHHEPLLGFVTHIVFDDPQAAEDVVQETFLRAWQHAEEVAPETAAPWLSLWPGASPSPRIDGGNDVGSR